MKRLTAILALALMLVPAALAQENKDHINLGVFVDYVRFTQIPGDINSVGLGGRLGVGVHKNVMLEGEMSYDFNRAFTENCTGCIPAATARTNFRILHGLFGPKFQTGGEHARVFFTVKGGFANFGLSSAPATFGTFTTTVSNIRQNTMNGALYPGGGFEFYGGPIGLRFDIGDLIWFNNGANHDLRVAAGPFLRF